MSNRGKRAGGGEKNRRGGRAVDQAARRGPSIPAESQDEELLAQRPEDQAARAADRDVVEEASKQSFPASDPPGWAGTSND